MTPNEETLIASQLGDVKTAIAEVHGRIDKHAERHERQLAEIRDRDLHEIKAKQDKTNGRVTGLERRYSELKGIGITVVALTPFGLFVLQKLI